MRETPWRVRAWEASVQRERYRARLRRAPWCALIFAIGLVAVAAARVAWSAWQ
jgi:hypothetical protein